MKFTQCWECAEKNMNTVMVLVVAHPKLHYTHEIGFCCRECADQWQLKNPKFSVISREEF